jgi:DNA-binding transcriptional ArsR family regulator
MASDHISRVLSALADPTRRDILLRLASGEATVTELAEPFSISQPAISKHLRVLEEAGLVSRSKDAQRRPRQLEAAALEDIAKWVELFRPHWEDTARRREEFAGLLSGDGTINW